MKFYKNTEFPKQDKYCFDISVEVIMTDENCKLEIGYYNFLNKKWYVDNNKHNLNLDNFIWWYPPNNIDKQFK